MMKSVALASLLQLCWSFAANSSLENNRAGEGQEKPVIERLDGVLLELVGPGEPLLPWLGSEWSLTVHNTGFENLPFTPLSFGPQGHQGVHVFIETSTVLEGKSTAVEYSSDNELAWVRMAANPNVPMAGCTFGPTRTKFFPIGESVERLLILHGQMMIDRGAFVRGDRVYRRFEPVFDSPGEYLVRTVLVYAGMEVESNVVQVVVAEPQARDLGALAQLKVLAESGVAVGIGGLGFRLTEKSGSPLATYVDEYAHTPYGQQIAVGWAKPAIAISKVWLGSAGSSEPDAKYSKQAIEHARGLLSRISAGDAGLTRTLAWCRSELIEREAVFSRKMKLLKAWREWHR